MIDSGEAAKLGQATTFPFFFFFFAFLSFGGKSEFSKFKQCLDIG